MENNKENEVVKRIEETIAIVSDKKSTLYFFVADARNIPNAKMEYIYQLAYTLHEKKYKVCMLYQLDNEYSEKELSELIRKNQPIDERRQFIGVKEWLGEKYGKLKHLNISNGTWQVAPSDFLFIPEVFSGLMKETYDKHVPCKRYVILQNFNHITEFIPFGDQWANYGITDAIVPSTTQGDLLKSVFKYVNVNVLPPYIPEYFRKPITAKKLIVNVVTREKHDAEHIIKMFYWKYRIFQFVPFRILVNFQREKYADMLKEGAITIWIDRDSSFGYNALESIRCGNITIGKIPEIVPEWMSKDDELLSNGIWVNDINTIPDVLASVVNEWIEDAISPEIYNAMDETSKLYSIDEWNTNVDTLFNSIFEKRVNDLKSVRDSIVNNNNKKETE